MWSLYMNGLWTRSYPWMRRPPMQRECSINGKIPADRRANSGGTHMAAVGGCS